MTNGGYAHAAPTEGAALNQVLLVGTPQAWAGAGDNRAGIWSGRRPLQHRRGRLCVPQELSGASATVQCGEDMLSDVAFQGLTPSLPSEAEDGEVGEPRGSKGSTPRPQRAGEVIQELTRMLRTSPLPTAQRCGWVPKNIFSNPHEFKFLVT